MFKLSADFSAQAVLCADFRGFELAAACSWICSLFYQGVSSITSQGNFQQSNFLSFCLLVHINLA